MSKVLPAMIYGAIALRSGSIIKEIVVDDDVLSVRCSIPVPPPSGFAPRVFGLMQPHADALSRKTGQHEKGKWDLIRPKECHIHQGIISMRTEKATTSIERRR